MKTIKEIIERNIFISYADDKDWNNIAKEICEEIGKETVYDSTCEVRILQEGDWQEFKRINGVGE